MKHQAKKIGVYAVTLLFWLAASAAVGVICGLLGGLFAMAVEWATHARGEYALLPWLMPVAGLVIAGLYRLLRLPRPSARTKSSRPSVPRRGCPWPWPRPFSCPPS